MLINIEKPLLILPEKILLLDQEQKNIDLKNIIENTIRHTADISSKRERDIYKMILELCMQGKSTEDGENLIELSHEEISLLEKWIYESPLKGFIKNSIIALLNGEY